MKGTRTDDVDDLAHLVEFVWTYVRTVCEAEVDDGPFAEEVFVCEDFPVLRLEPERPAYASFAVALVLCRLDCSMYEPVEEKGEKE